MTPSGKSIGIIVFSYLLFGLFNLLQFGVFIVPLPYTDLIVFTMVAVVFVQNWKQLQRPHIFLLTYALIGFLAHPFLWEIFLNQTQQFSLFNSLAFDVLKIVQLIVLAIFFFIESYDKNEHKLKIEWLIPAVLVLGCLLNPPMWYVSIVFIISGLSAFYTLGRRTIGTNFTMELLIGIGIIYAVNLFFVV